MRTWRHLTFFARHITSSSSSASSVHPSDARRGFEQVGSTFSSIGASPRLTENLKKRFNIETPTPAQAAFFPAIMSHRDVILKDETGSGKTFGLVAALLSKKYPPLYRDQAKMSEKPASAESLDDNVDGDTNETPRKASRVRYLQAMIILPTPELALQVYNWARDLLSGIPAEDLPKHVQCLVPQTSTELQRKLFQPPYGPPKLLIGTGRKILDFVRSKDIDLTNLQTVVLDEVDSLVRVPKRFETVKEKFNRQVHPLHSEYLLDEIMRIRRPSTSSRLPDLSTNSNGKKESKKSRPFIKSAPASIVRVLGDGPAARRLQVVICSATLNSHTRRELEKRRGWVEDPILLDIKGGHAAPKNIQHFCLILDADTATVRNIRDRDEEQKAYDEVLSTVQSEEASKDKSDSNPNEPQIMPLWKLKMQKPALADDSDTILEQVASICQAEAITRGILFLNSNISIMRVVEKLRSFGIKAGRAKEEVDYDKASGVLKYSADNNQQELYSSFFSGENHLLVVTEHTARGLDLPLVTHVIMVGPPSSPGSYLHMSGRVGRFGKPGKSILLLGGERYERKMMDTFKLINVKPSEWEFSPKI
ncbi:hypothetical protein HDV05_000139 [Chytridiales sp. JEL 0842]|nr:hypothetical protein HDV05_000139 [Chytridiales sp. JEL 0842]